MGLGVQSFLLDRVLGFSVCVCVCAVWGVGFRH